MKKIKKISTVLALLAFTLLYSASLAFAATPPGIPSPFGGSNDDGPPTLHGPDQPSGNGTQQDPIINNGSPGSANNSQTAGNQGAPYVPSGNRSTRNPALNGTENPSSLDNAVADAQNSQDAASRDAADSGNEPDNLTGTGPELIYLILPTLGLSASYFIYKNKK